MSFKTDSKYVNLLFEETVKKYILPHYNLSQSDIFQIKLKNTAKQRAVFKIKNSIEFEEDFCLKKVYYEKPELLFIYSALEWLWHYDIKVTRLLKTRENSRYAEHDQLLFILTNWIEGEKCDYDNTAHLTSATETLAKIHKVSQNFIPLSGSAVRGTFENLYHLETKHFNNLKNFYKNAVYYSDRFSKLFIKNYEKIEALAKSSVAVAETIDHSKLKRSICHRDYVNKNMIFDKNNCLWLIDFDKCGIDYCIHDVSYFLRRLMRRKHTLWNVSILTNCLELYEKNNILNSDEYKYLLAYLSFPQRVWKSVRTYESCKSPREHTQLLNMLKRSIDEISIQQQFSLNLSSFIKNRFI